MARRNGVALGFSVGAAWLAGWGAAAWGRGGCAYDFGPLTALVEQGLASVPTQGAVVIVERRGEPLYARGFGTWGLNRSALTASAGKWISAAVVMSVVDSGQLTLDSTTGEVLGWAGVKGTITLRQLFSHTSGFRNAPCLNDEGTTLAACVEEIYLNEALSFAPGTAFGYGGAGMQVAGRMCEVATGRPWNELFAERLATPLGWTATRYESATNPRIGGGQTSTGPEYARLLRMFLAGGVYGGARVLTEASVSALLSEQTGGVPPISLPPTIQGEYLGYGIGSWVFRLGAGGEPVDFSSPGAFGWTPWVDLERGVSAMLVVQTQGALVDGLADAMRPVVRAIIDAGTIAGDTNGDGRVDFADLNRVLTEFGQGGSLAGDVNGDGVVNFADLNVVLTGFGGEC